MSKFQKAVSDSAIKLRAWGKFINIIGAGLQIVLQSMDVPGWVTISIAFLNLVGVALPALTPIYEGEQKPEIQEEEQPNKEV